MNLVGYSAYFLVAALSLLSLNSRILFILSIIGGIDRISLGEASNSQIHQRFSLCKNSLAPKNCLIYFSTCGYIDIKILLSSDERKKFPSSTGILPFCILGISEIGFLRFSINMTGRFIKYGFMISTIEHSLPLNILFSFLVQSVQNPIITQCTCAFSLASLSH